MRRRQSTSPSISATTGTSSAGASAAGASLENPDPGRGEAVVGKRRVLEAYSEALQPAPFVGTLLAILNDDEWAVILEHCDLWTLVSVKQTCQELRHRAGTVIIKTASQADRLYDATRFARPNTPLEFVLTTIASLLLRHDWHADDVATWLYAAAKRDLPKLILPFRTFVQPNSTPEHDKRMARLLGMDDLVTLDVVLTTTASLLLRHGWNNEDVATWLYAAAKQAYSKGSLDPSPLWLFLSQPWLRNADWSSERIAKWLIDSDGNVHNACLFLWWEEDEESYGAGRDPEWIANWLCDGADCDAETAAMFMYSADGPELTAEEVANWLWRKLDTPREAERVAAWLASSLYDGGPEWPAEDVAAWLSNHADAAPA